MQQLLSISEAVTSVKFNDVYPFDSINGGNAHGVRADDVANRAAGVAVGELGYQQQVQ